MSESYNYDLKIEGLVADREYLIYRLFKTVSEARAHLDENGKSVGGDYDWRSLEDDMRTFSKLHPDFLFIIDERTVYDGEVTEVRHYSKNGRYVALEPVVVVTWPDFSEALLY